MEQSPATDHIFVPGFEIKSVISTAFGISTLQAVQNIDQSPVFIKLSNEDGALEFIIKEFSFVKELKIDPVLKALLIDQNKFGPVSVFESFKGKTISSLSWRSNLNPINCIDVMTNVVKAYSEISDCSVIHKMISPESILVDDSNEVIKL